MPSVLRVVGPEVGGLVGSVVDVAQNHRRRRRCWTAGKASLAELLVVYTSVQDYILIVVSKHLVDIDEEALLAARAELGTNTIKATVNAALRAAGSPRAPRVAAALDLLADAELADRENAWR